MSAHGSLAPGQHMVLGRFHVHARHYQRPSPVMDLMLWRMLGELLRDSGLAWSFIVFRDDGFWDAHMTFCDMAPLDRPVVVGGHPYRIFAHDWRDASPGDWLAEKQRTLLTDTDGDCGPAVTDRFPAPAPVMTRQEFAAAVRSALRDLRRPEALEANPLSRSRLVVDHGTTLREVLSNAVAGLVTGRGGDKAHRVATLAFLEGAPTQEAAARRLHMPYSTYRRHLATATSRIEERLWQHEQAGLPLLTP
ncbi:hypothetical protein ACFQ9Z_18455 [Streptomyces sp. NPDC056580]|uniref:hypothetical protein n=1 Tax=Streptomyces sp. NPDC056580 TaxID=3345872 RepID=UPI00369B8EAE